MTTITVFIICAIVLVFVLFGSVLAWADFYSRPVRRARPAAPPSLVSHNPPHPAGHRDAA